LTQSSFEPFYSKLPPHPPTRGNDYAPDNYEYTKAAAQTIIDAEKKKHEAVTARLREARLTKEAEDLMNQTAPKPQVKKPKAKAWRPR
jgi:hypothetical protein